jgi:hypothetical protein
MKTLCISITILCGVAIATLIYYMVNNWAIPLTTIITWISACILCPFMRVKWI